MIGIWGTYRWFAEDGVKKIHPDDLEDFKIIVAYGSKVFECIDEDSRYISIKYGDKVFRVTNDLFKQVSAPKFNIGQNVIIKEKGAEAIIIDIMWHYDKQDHFYFVALNGKKKSRRYFTFELEG